MRPHADTTARATHNITFDLFPLPSSIFRPLTAAGPVSSTQTDQQIPAGQLRRQPAQCVSRREDISNTRR